MFPNAAPIFTAFYYTAKNMKPFIFSKKNLSAGFTLIEVLAVVVMVAVLAALAAPSWLQYLNNQRIGSVKSDLVQSLKQAQQDAIRQRQTVTVEVRTPNNLDGEENLPAINSSSSGVQLMGNRETVRPGMVLLDVYSFDGQGGNKDDDDTQLLSFDYQGTVREQNLPYVINITMEGYNKQQCVIVSSLVGSIKTARNDECDNPTVNPG